MRCILCAHDLAPTEVQTCLRCLGRVRAGLASIARLFDLLPSMLANLGSASALDSVLARGGDDACLPGGDLLVMLGPGSSSHVGHPSDPPAVAFELGTWCEDWAEIRGEVHDPETHAQPGGLVPAERVRRSEGPCIGCGDHLSVAGAVEWLSVRCGWSAAHHPAWPEFASDVRRIELRLREVTGWSDRPERGVSCPFCGVALLRWATDEGYLDEWKCARCRRAFDGNEYDQAKWLAQNRERMQA